MPVIIDPNEPLFDEIGRPIRRNWFAPRWISELETQDVTPGSIPPATYSPEVPAQTSSYYSPAEPTDVELSYLEKLRSYPRYTPPGKLQRVLAAIAGGTEGYLKASPMAGVRAARETLEAPHQARLARWKEEVAPLKEQTELMQTLHERGVDISKLGLTEYGIGATREAALARVAQLAVGQQLLEEHRQEMRRIRQLELNRRISADRARELENEAKREFNERVNQELNKYRQEELKLGARRVAVAEKREKRLGVRPPGFISPSQQEDAEVLGTLDVLRDPEVQRKFPANVDILKVYFDSITDLEGRAAGYRLKPVLTADMDENLFRFLQAKINAAARRRLSVTRGVEGTAPLFSIEEEEEEEP